MFAKRLASKLTRLFISPSRFYFSRLRGRLAVTEPETTLAPTFFSVAVDEK